MPWVVMARSSRERSRAKEKGRVHWGAFGVGIGEVSEGKDVALKGTGGFETRQQGVVEVVMEPDDKNLAVRTGRVIGPELAGGDVSGEGEAEEGGAATGCAIQEGEFALGMRPGHSQVSGCGAGSGCAGMVECSDTGAGEEI